MINQIQYDYLDEGAKQEEVEQEVVRVNKERAR
jgi:hypothetical protein